MRFGRKIQQTSLLDILFMQETITYQYRMLIISE